MWEACTIFHSFLGTTGKNKLSVSCTEYFGRKDGYFKIQVMVLQRHLRLKPISAGHLLNSKPSHIYSPVKSLLQGKGSPRTFVFSSETFLITITAANPVWTGAGDNQQVKLSSATDIRTRLQAEECNSSFWKRQISVVGNLSTRFPVLDDKANKKPSFQAQVSKHLS